MTIFLAFQSPYGGSLQLSLLFPQMGALWGYVQASYFLEGADKIFGELPQSKIHFQCLSPRLQIPVEPEFANGRTSSPSREIRTLVVSGESSVIR